MTEYSLSSVSGKAKKHNLGELIGMGAVVTDPEEAGFQARNLQPIDPEFARSLKDSGGWSPSQPGSLVRYQGKLIILNGNTRARAFLESGIDEGWFVEEKLAREDDAMELHRLRLHLNNVAESDPWTKAETYARGEQDGLTPEEQAIGVSATTVKKWLRIYHVVKSLGPKPKAEEKPEQTKERLAKAKESQDKAVAKIRTGEVTAGDILKFFEKELNGEDFDKSFKALVSKKKQEKAAAGAVAREKVLTDYVDTRIPAKFFPDLVAMIAKSEGLTITQKDAAIGVLQCAMGNLPRDKFLAGDFTVPKSEPKKKKSDEDDEDLEDAELDEEEKADSADDVKN